MNRRTFIIGLGILTASALLDKALYKKNKIKNNTLYSKPPKETSKLIQNNVYSNDASFMYANYIPVTTYKGLK